MREAARADRYANVSDFPMLPVRSKAPHRQVVGGNGAPGPTTGRGSYRGYDQPSIECCLLNCLALPPLALYIVEIFLAM